MSEFWYRYYDRIEMYGVSIVELKIPVRRNTRVGVWLYDRSGARERWCSMGARKSWAYPTKELAWQSFQIRKRKQLAYAQQHIERVEAALVHAKEPVFDSGMSYPPVGFAQVPLTSVTDVPICRLNP